MKKKIVFVLLHYNTIADTKKIVKQIMKLPEFSNGEIQIIIVDNASPNQTGYDLKRLYKDFDGVDVLLSEKNMGFAKGNNLGIQKGLSDYECEFIIVSNTDIEIISDNFITSIDREYERSNFSILGPDIIKPVQNILIHQNPIKLNQKITLKFIKSEKHRIIYTELRVNFILRIKRILEIIGLKKKKNITQPSIPNNQYYQGDLILHGSFLIFHRTFFESFPDGFYKKTFMYGEEHILSYMVQSKGLRMVYNPTIKVVHHEGKATLSEKNQIQRNTFLRKEATKSFNQLIELIKNNGLKEK